MRAGWFPSGISTLLWSLADVSAAESRVRTVRIQDIATIEGVRENALIGYGVVAGLKDTGDRQQTVFPSQKLESILRRTRAQIPAPASSPQARNVAAVFMTATLPPFAAPGTRIDVEVASVGDARSLEGGVLLLSPLYAADGQTYAAAQGAVVPGGARPRAACAHPPAAGRVRGGGLVERDAPVELAKPTRLSLLLRDHDFGTSQTVAQAINGRFGRSVACAVDGRRVEIRLRNWSRNNVSRALAQIGDLEIAVHEPAWVVVSERTGAIVMGERARLGACSILHGNLAVEIAAAPEPPPAVPGRTLAAANPGENRIELREGATVQDLAARLQRRGAAASDVVAILEAVKAAGALQAEIEVI